MKLIQSGPRSAKIMFVGEAPGETEMRTGTPFTGGSGDLLNRMLGNPRINIDRSKCFFTNVCHIRPQGKKSNDFSWFFTAEGMPHLQEGLLRLMADVAEIRPNLVIALGAVPMYFLTKKGTFKSGKISGIDKWRGSILESVLVPGQKVIPTYHPAFLLRSWDHKAVAELDLARCAQDAEFRDLRLPTRQLYLNPQGSARREIMAEMLDTDLLAVDIECTRSKRELICVGFSDRPDRALVIHAASDEDREDIATMVRSPCDKVMQNGQFDYTILTEDAGMEVVGFSEHVGEHGVRGWDTMLAHHTLYLESAGGEDEYSALNKGGPAGRKNAALKKGLAFLTSIYTREPFYKDDGKLWESVGDLRMFWRYNALDAAVTREVQLVQSRELDEFGVRDSFLRKMHLLRPLMACTNRGIPVDLIARAELQRKLENECAGLQLVLDTVAGRPINVKSNGANGDVAKLLYGELGLPTQFNRETKQPTVDKDALVKLAERSPHPALLTILSIRERRTALENQLGDSVGPDGRERCNYDPTGTRTNRLSSRATIRGEGKNLQNVMDRVRRVYIPSPGKVFIQPDYSPAEARVVAYLALTQSLIDLFSDSSKDIHRFNASRFYGVPELAVTYEMRFCAKIGVHSGNYGVGAEKTMKVINALAKDSWGKKGTGITVDLHTARKIVEGYFALYPRIKTRFWADVRDNLRRDRTLTGVFGTRRVFFGRWDGDDEGHFLNSAYSFIPQNAIGELCTGAMDRIESNVSEVTVLGNVHDSILVECDDDLDTIERACDRMRSEMTIPITIHGHTFTIPSEFAVGSNWGKASEDNPNGLMLLDKWLELRSKVSSASSVGLESMKKVAIVG